MQTAARLHEIADDLRGVAGEISAAMAGLRNDELLDVMSAIEEVGRVVSAAQVRVAGEVGVRSRSELGDEGLSRSQNFTSTAMLVARVTGASTHESKARLEIGRRLRGAVLLGGGEGPASFPHVAQMLDAGILGVETASIIVKRCGELTERGCCPDVVAGAEQTLVDQAITQRLTTDQTARLALHLRELIDPDGAEPRDEAHQQQRSLTIAQASDGMIRGRFALTPEQGGVWLASIQAMQSPRVSGSHPGGPRSLSEDEFVSHAGGPRFLNEDEFVAHTATADTRTQAQKNADTVTELIARAAGGADMPRINGATTTVNVQPRGRAWRRVDRRRRRAHPRLRRGAAALPLPHRRHALRPSRRGAPPRQDEAPLHRRSEPRARRARRRMRVARLREAALVLRNTPCE